MTATQSGNRLLRGVRNRRPQRRCPGASVFTTRRSLSPVPDSLTPILYRVPTRPVTKRYVMIEETETDGDVVWGGPFAVGDERQRLAFDTVERLMDEAGIPYGQVQRTRGMRPLRPRPRPGRSPLGRRRTQARATERAGTTGGRSSRATRCRPGPSGEAGGHGVKILVHRPGRVEVPLDALLAAGLPRCVPGASRPLDPRQPVPYQWEQDRTRAWSIVFQAQGLSHRLLRRQRLHRHRPLRPPGPRGPPHRLRRPAGARASPASRGASSTSRASPTGPTPGSGTSSSPAGPGPTPAGTPPPATSTCRTSSPAPPVRRRSASASWDTRTTPTRSPPRSTASPSGR